MQIIPAIDIYQNQCVRLTGGDFSSRTDYKLDPFEVASKYAKAGAQWIHVVDLEGAKNGAMMNLPAIVQIRTLKDTKIQAGGGIRSDADVERLITIGIDRVLIGSIALRSPEILERWIERFGGNRFCVTLDVKDGALAYNGWQSVGTQAIDDVVPRLIDAGVNRFLSTDIRRDGTLAGPNVQLYSSLVQKYPGVEWIASGGVRTKEDIQALSATGVSGVVVGKALYEGTIILEDVLKENMC